MPRCWRAIPMTSSRPIWAHKGTWYRLRVGGLADREVAVALCDRLKADGGACILGH